MMKTSHTTILLLMFGLLCNAQPIPPDSLYFGQTPPGNTPQMFAPGIVSLPGRNEACITFSPDGASVFFYIEKYPMPGDPYILYATYANNHWTTPDTIPFSAGRACAEPIFAPGGNRLYLNATNTVSQQGIRDLCYSEKQGNNWSVPISMGDPPNSEPYQYHPCIVGDSSVWFSSSAGSVCRSQYNNGSYETRVILPRPVNFIGSQTWGDPFVAPDETYMLIKCIRPEGYGQNDIYIAYKKTDGSWTNPKNLGNVINTPLDETTGDITTDGLYMTYGSDKDLYWVGTGFIDSLKYTNFLPYVKTPIPDQVAYVGTSFTYIIPDSTFFDDDGNTTLSFSAQLANGNPLPSWLSFDSLTVTFSGIPPATGILFIKVTATDTAGAVASATMKLQVKLASAAGRLPEYRIQVCPNPCKGLLHLSPGYCYGDEARFDVLAFQGKVLLSGILRKESTLDLSPLPDGIYKLRITAAEHTGVCTVVIQH
jgi:hypothetical protein